MGRNHRRQAPAVYEIGSRTQQRNPVMKNKIKSFAMSLIIKAIKIVGYICGLSLLLETTSTSNPSFQFIQTPSVIYIGSHCVAAISCIYIANKFSKILSDITQKWLLALITLIILPQHLEYLLA